MKRFKIKYLWGFFAIDEDGNESICGVQLEDRWMPLITAQESMLDSLRIIAHRMSTSEKRKIKLVKFRQRTELEEIIPSKLHMP
jgi:hypothetical protein